MNAHDETDNPLQAEKPAGPDDSVQEVFDIEYDDLSPGVSPEEQTEGRLRPLQIIVGVLLVIAGTAMLVIPGPGIVTILVGLNMIKPDNALVRYIRRRTPGIPEDGAVPRGHIVLGLILIAGSTVIGILWGSDITAWLRGVAGL